MNCIEAEPYVSILYDGEPVPLQAADHIDDCAACHQRLRSYSHIGAEIRLMASRAAPVVTIPTEFSKKVTNRRFGFLRGRVVTPRAALAALALLCLATLSASWTIAHAQNTPRWFQFELRPESFQTGGNYHAAKAGSKDKLGWIFASPGNAGHAEQSTRVAARFEIESIDDRKVVLQVGARNLHPGDAIGGPELLRNFQTLDMHRIVYTPGAAMTISIEGGGNLTLRGEVLDHQPQIASGYPLEPGAGQLILRSPVLLQGDRVLTNQQGGTSMADGNSTVSLDSPGVGRFVFGLQEFPGAVRGEATWSYLTFRIGNQSYKLTSEAAICGGAQPHTVWVALE